MAEIGFSTGSLSQMISDAYNAGSKYQWVREGFVNAVEAGANYIEFGIEMCGLHNSETRRRFIADNGIGMSPDELLTFMSTYGGSGKTIGDDGNKGIGFKSSTFQWNPEGILVASWTRDSPDGAMIWIYFNEETGRWSTWDWELSDGRISSVCPVQDVEFNGDTIGVADMRPEALRVAGHGTVILLLGSKEFPDTEAGDPERGELSDRAIIGFINSRFLEIPEGITVKVFGVSGKEGSLDVDQSERYHDKVLTTKAGNKKTVRGRGIYGYRHYAELAGRTAAARIESGALEVPDGVPASASGTIRVPALKPGSSPIEVEWFFSAEPVNASSDRQYSAPPSVAYRYDQLAHGGTLLSEAYALFTSAQHLRNYGLSSPQARNRFWLVVHLPEWSSTTPNRWGVIPNGARSALSGKGGNPTFDDMVEYVSGYVWEDANLRALLVKLSAPVGDEDRDDKGRAKRLERISAQIGARIRYMTRLVTNPAGTVRGTDGGPAAGTVPRVNGGGGRPKVRVGPGLKPTRGMGDPEGTLNPDEDGDQTGSFRRRGLGFPQIEWCDREKFSAQFDGDPEWTKRIALWSEKENTVYINQEFDVFAAQRTYWAEVYPKLDEAVIAKTIRTKYEDLLVSIVAHVTSLNGRHQIPGGERFVGGPSGDINEMLNPAALTTALMGFINVEAQLRTTFGSIGGKATESPAA